MGRVHLEALRRLGIGGAAFRFGGRDEAAFRAALAESRDPRGAHLHAQRLHFPMAKAALEAGKHVLCEKPLATSSAEARALVELAAREEACATALATICAIIRWCSRCGACARTGDLGEILVVQGTYSQDWLLYETDWNWRVDSKDGGPSRALADIGSHLCDMAEHVTGQRITSLCADLQTFHKTRKKPKGAVETFAGKTLAPRLRRRSRSIPRISAR